MNIGVVGYGDIGQAIEGNFEDKCIVGVYDDNYSAQDGPQFCSSVVELAKGSDFVFITLPVSIDKDCDSSLIDKAMYDVLVEGNVGASSPIAVIVTDISQSVISKYLAIYKEDQFVVFPESVNSKIVCGSQTTAEKVNDLYDNYSFLGGHS